MCPLRRVKDARAGPRAVGILIPPGPRTVVVLRPRSLNWDLLLLRGDTPSDASSPFREFTQEQALQAARALFQSLLAWSEKRIPGRIEPVSSSDGSTHQVQAEIGAFNLIVCQRQPGRPYRPKEFSSAEDARAVAEVLAAKLRPMGVFEQEVYFNTRNFTMKGS